MCQALGAALVLPVTYVGGPSCSTCPEAWLAPSRYRPFAVFTWMAEGLMLVWRAGACSHDLLALQPVLHAAWGAAALQFWLPTWLSS